MTTPVPLIPDLIDRDPAAIEAAIVAELAAILGRELQPAQVERIIASVFAYRETLVRIAIQDAALQTYVAFARAPFLDFLGEIVGATRLAAAAAETTLRFTLVGVQPGAIAIPAGTRVQSTDGAVIFATSEQLVILAGDTTGDVEALAAVPGEAANEYIADTITAMLDLVAFVASATNLTTTANGTEVETDDHYRDRIRQAPSQFSVAGSVGAYRFHTLSVSASIIDAAVTSPSPGSVRVYVLTDAGLPGGPLLADVAAALSADRVRPLTDTVEVVAPTEVPFLITAVVRVLSGADQAATLASAIAAAEAYAADRRAGLGRDIVQSQVTAALSVPGVYQVALTEPAADTDVDATEWANCTAVDVTLGAPAEG